MIGNIMDRVQRFYFLPKPYFRNSMLPHRECKNLTIEMGGGDSEHAEYILWCRDCDRKILNEFGLFFNDSYEGSYTPLSVPQHLTHHIPNDHEQKLDYLQNAWIMLEDSKEIEESNLVPYPQDDDREVEGRGPRQERGRRVLERLCVRALASPAPRLRADDGSLRHRPHEDRAQALRDRLPLRERRARTGLPDQRTGTRARFLRDTGICDPGAGT